MSSTTDLRRKLTREIALHIKQSQLPVGARLTEKSLCETFNVSRTPIRAALRSLAEAGAVSYVKNRGYFTTAAAGDIDGTMVPDSDEETLYLRITRDRFSGELADEFTEADLVRRYGAPRRALTRLLHRLSREMLVEKRPGHGWSFAEILDSQQAHDESYRFRLCIEPSALLEPTFRIDRAILAESRAAHEKMLKGDSGSISSIALFEMNADFHQMLADFSGNRFFQEAMRRQNNLRRIISYQWVYGPDRVIDTCQEHLAIIEATVSGDMMWAASLLRKHISTAAEISPYDENAASADPWHIDVAGRR